MRLRFLILPCLLAALSAQAAPREGSADPPAKARRPFLERTVVAYPRTIGAYTLDTAQYDPANVGNGVALRYAVADVPLRLDVYVYPLGRGPADLALAGGMDEVEAAIRDFERRGVYRDVRFGEITPFSVRWSDRPPAAAVDADGDPVPAPAAVPAGVAAETRSQAADDPKADAEARKVAALVGTMLDAPRETPGRRRGMQMLHDGEPVQSLAFLFYRQLYLVKVRASAPIAAGAQADFEAAVDRAVTTIVPALRIGNSGACQEMTIGVPSGAAGEAASDAILSGLGSEMGRIVREGCNATSLGEPLPAGYERQVLEFPADAWRSE